MEREVREITAVSEWLAWRRSDLTASRIAALFDAHPFMSREQIAVSLRGESAGPNAAMRRGNRLEPAVIAAVQEDHPEWSVAKVNRYYRLPEHRLGATPDALGTHESGGVLNVQCKTVSPAKWEEWRGHPPLGYSLQVVSENLAVDAAHGVLAVMVAGGSHPVHYFDVPRHDEAEAKILAAVAAFWASWDAGEIAGPAPVAEIAAAVDDGSHLDLSGDNLLTTLLPERAKLKADVGAAETRLKEIDDEIKNRIGPARTAWCNGWLIKYPTLNRKEYTVKAGSYRRLDVAEKEMIDAE